ncbi:hypothetical protein [Sphingomonas humi]|uniref:Copper chaperone PCu(A)C n=1 Tax=Sphingomonas humi TaxID=335630 RepID=A0ABP7RTT5_9SPHN
MTRAALFAALASTLAAAPALAVGLGPLRNEGTTLSERKGFYLTLINPYPGAHRFRMTAIGMEDETVQPRVVIPAGNPVLGAQSQRRLLVFATGLKPGETMSFRVCAERDAPLEKELIHARVCAKLVAHRRA